jgi:hypothetical protein
MKTRLRPIIIVVLTLFFAAASRGDDVVGITISGERVIAQPGKDSPWKKDITKSVRPTYPPKDEATGHEGWGRFRLLFDPKSGAVAKVITVHSTGYSSLDNAFIAALQQWRVRPGTWQSFDVPAVAEDEAEMLSRRVPNQSYYVGEADGSSILRLGSATWAIPLWACSADSLAIIKVLGNSAPAPYAIAITPSGNNPIDEIDTNRRLYIIHLLAASKEDAIKMRQALLNEIETAKRNLEKRQGHRPRA